MSPNYINHKLKSLTPTKIPCQLTRNLQGVRRLESAVLGYAAQILEAQHSGAGQLLVERRVMLFKLCKSAQSDGVDSLCVEVGGL